MGKADSASETPNTLIGKCCRLSAQDQIVRLPSERRAAIIPVTISRLNCVIPSANDRGAISLSIFLTPGCDHDTVGFHRNPTLYAPGIWTKKLSSAPRTTPYARPSGPN